MPNHGMREVFAGCKLGNPLVLFPIAVLRLHQRTANHVPLCRCASYSGNISTFSTATSIFSRKWLTTIILPFTAEESQIAFAFCKPRASGFSRFASRRGHTHGLGNRAGKGIRAFSLAAQIRIEASTRCNSHPKYLSKLAQPNSSQKLDVGFSWKLTHCNTVGITLAYDYFTRKEAFYV